MTLEELFWIVNDCSEIELYSAETNDVIETYGDQNEVPDEYLCCEVTDVFPMVKGDPKSPAGCYPCLGIEIEVEE